MKILVALVGLWTTLAAAQSCAEAAGNETAGGCSTTFVTALSASAVTTIDYGAQFATQASNSSTPYSALPGVSPKSSKTVNPATVTQVVVTVAATAAATTAASTSSSTHSNSAAAIIVPWSGVALGLVGLVMAGL
ncbi:hypothetical protein BP5796_05626 [Coleophoma crateriformis]|uniref:Uncharacterized protein n=1 Tax=Coleophoma crateriformis TaxID=565419 RepID=A0A3D8S3T7_9HELO|nr:hypothetical protein BP5796_05626 [Coleophoma crateriformis]